MMNEIIHFTTVHPRYDIRIFSKECITLSNSGYNVKLFVADGICNEVKNNVNIHSIQKPKNRFERLFFSQFKMLFALIKEKPKVFHFHDPELLFIGLFLRLLGKKVIFDMHEDTPSQILSKPYLNKFQSQFLFYVVKLFEYITLPFMSHIFTVNDQIVSRVSKLNKNISLLRNFPILNEFIEVQQDWKNKENAIFYVGAISEIRGLKQVIQALGKTNIKLYLAGTFNDTKFHEDLTKLPGWANVIYLGQINRLEMIKYFKIAKLGIIPFLPAPNHINANPNKFYEYLSAGLPIACSDFNLWKSFTAKHNIGITFNPNSSEDIKVKLLKYMSNIDHLEKMSIRAKTLIKEKYNWTAESEELINIYSNITR